MKKITIRAKVKSINDWTYGVSISKLKEDLAELEKLGATEIEIEPYEEYGGAYVNINALAIRLETDEEFNIRVEKENKRKQDIKDRELAELNRLKSKYEQ